MGVAEETENYCCTSQAKLCVHVCVSLLPRRAEDDLDLHVMLPGQYGEISAENPEVAGHLSPRRAAPGPDCGTEIALHFARTWALQWSDWGITEDGQAESWCREQSPSAPGVSAGVGLKRCACAYAARYMAAVVARVRVVGGKGGEREARRVQRAHGARVSRVVCAARAVRAHRAAVPGRPDRGAGTVARGRARSTSRVAPGAAEPHK